MNKLKAYATEKGYVMIDQWGPIDVHEFRSSWKLSSATGAEGPSSTKRTVGILAPFGFPQPWM